MSKEKELVELMDSINLTDLKTEDLNKISSYLKTLDISMLRDSTEVTIKKFIKFSIHIIKHCHKDLVNYLTATSNLLNAADVTRLYYLFFYTFSPIVNISDKSFEFCDFFHQEESENGIKVLFNLLIDEQVISLIIKAQTVQFKESFKRFMQGNGFMALLNISKAYDKNKEKWSDLNAFKTLLDLSKRIQNDTVNLKLMMTMGNIASDEDLNNFSAAPNKFECLTNQIKRFAKALVEKAYNQKSEFSREFFQIEGDKEKVEIIQDNERLWNLYECLQALYKFAINDKLKNTIYETFNMKESLNEIIFNGNKTEQEYAFKVLYQLGFDKSIAIDISKNDDLLNFMKSIVSEQNDSTNKLVKNVTGVLWLINNKDEDADNKTVKQKNVEGKHIFISYNNESRQLCLKIKEFLESRNLKCWIDVENIHGSSIDAMAKGIETSLCVLICMTEKYKESNNCRMEAEYVLQKKKPFIPIIMQKSFKPDGWFVFIQYFYSDILLKVIMFNKGSALCWEQKYT